MNKLYQSQFLLLAFISVVVFKIAMLPSYLSSVTSDSILCMAVMMIIELLMLIIVYGIISETSLIDMNIPEGIKKILICLIFFSLCIKISVFTIEGSTYVANYVFENLSIELIIMPLLLIVFYMAYKGINNIAKVAEIMFWVLAFAFLFNIIFASSDINLTNIKWRISGEIAVAADRHFIWFGDFTPLLMGSIVKKRKRSIFAVITAIFIVVCPVLLTIAFIGIYGEAGTFIEYAFAKLAVYNKVSMLIGSFDIPTIIAFLISMIIKLSIIAFALVEILTYFINKKKICALIIYFLIFASSVFIFKKIENSYRIATSFLRFVVAGIEYVVPMCAYIFMNHYKKKQVMQGLNYV